MLHLYDGKLLMIINVKASRLVAQDPDHDGGNVDLVPFELENGRKILRPSITTNLAHWIGVALLRLIYYHA